MELVEVILMTGQLHGLSSWCDTAYAYGGDLLRLPLLNRTELGVVKNWNFPGCGTFKDQRGFRVGSSSQCSLRITNSLVDVQLLRCPMG